MRQQYENLLDLMHDEAAASMASNAMWGIRVGHMSLMMGLQHIGDIFCARYGLSATYIGNAVVFRKTTSRAKDPTVLVVQQKQEAHPNADAFRMAGEAVFQLFLKESDFAGLEGTGPRTPDWHETQDTLLLQ